MNASRGCRTEILEIPATGAENWSYFHAVRKRKSTGASGGADAPKRAHKVACAVPVRKLNAAEDNKLKEKPKNVSEERKSTDQKLKEYLELKDGKKIQIFNDTCLEESLVSYRFRDTGCSGVIVKRELITEEQRTGKIGYVITHFAEGPICECGSKHALLQQNGGSFVPKGPSI